MSSNPILRPVPLVGAPGLAARVSIGATDQLRVVPVASILLEEDSTTPCFPGVTDYQFSRSVTSVFTVWVSGIRQKKADYKIMNGVIRIAQVIADGLTGEDTVGALYL